MCISNMVYDFFAFSLFGNAFSDPLEGDCIKLLPYLFGFQHMLSIWRQSDQRSVDRVSMCRGLSMMQYLHTLQ